MDYLNDLPAPIDLQQINAIRSDREKWLTKKGVLPFQEAVESVDAFTSAFIDVTGAAVEIGKREELTDSQFYHLETSIRTLLPWRKGPFKLFGRFIDSEWKSNLKWDRVAPHLDDLKDRVVADVGCGNGYYMFKMAAANPRLVIGFDPMTRFYHTFNFVNRFAGFDCLKFELLGAEHTSLFKEMFDIVLCMGVLYHTSDPVGILKNMMQSMKPGAQLIVESQGVLIEGPYALFPEQRYAKARNVWFVPGPLCLENWIKRAGFVDVECFSVEAVTPLEQRTTTDAPWESLKDFLDPSDHSKTIEGYPAPVRIAIKARKRN